MAETLAHDEHLSSAELFKRYAPFVAKFVMRMGVPRADLDDLIQEIFLIAHRNGGYQPGPAKPTTYLANIAFRMVYTERRKRQVRSFVEANETQVTTATAAGDPEGAAVHQQHMQQLQRALDSLDPDKRAIFVLAELQGETVASVAAGLGIPVDTAYSRLRAAKKLFSQSVQAQINTDPTARLAG